MTIVTYTPNPAVDLWQSCDVLRPTEKTRVSGTRYDPGGGGINVARVLHTLGRPTLAVHLAGGATRDLFDTLLARTGVPGLTIPVAGDTRISTTVLERSTGLEYRFVPEGPAVTPQECRAALDALATVEGRWLAASGSLPPGTPLSHYAEAAALARARGLRVALDGSGAALATTVAAGGVDLLKASREELRQLVGRPLPDRSDVVAAAAELALGGRVGMVAASLGPDGAVLATGDGILVAEAPRIEVRSTVGAGDSMLAGLLGALDAGRPPAEALAEAVAAGSAACLHEGTQLAAPADIDRLVPGVRVHAG